MNDGLFGAHYSCCLSFPICVLLRLAHHFHSTGVGKENWQGNEPLDIGDRGRERTMEPETLGKVGDF